MLYINCTNAMLTMLSNSGPLTEMKLNPASFATALASRVLPQPGGPQSNTPDGLVNPMSAYSSLC